MSNIIDRRQFLRTLSSAGAGAALTVAGGSRALAAPAADPNQPVAALDTRAYASVQRYALSMGGGNSGWIQSAEGGRAHAMIVEERLGIDTIVRKHLASVRYDDVTVRGGSGMPQAVYDWIGATLARQQNRQDGCLMGLDADYKTSSLLEFYGAQLIETGFPALDAASPEPGLLSLRFAPEFTRLHRARKLPPRVPALPATHKGKRWLTSNFRLRIDGLEDSCLSVRRIEPMNVRQPQNANAAGEFRDYEIAAAPLQIPNLVVTLPEVRADAFYDWFDDFVIKGNCGQDAEKNATLEMLAGNLKEVLFTLNFNNLGIFRMTPVTNPGGMNLIKVEMYCEDMGFAASPGVAA